MQREIEAIQCLKQFANGGICLLDASAVVTDGLQRIITLIVGLNACVVYILRERDESTIQSKNQNH
jgi:hypothetical protein